jgi:hypothetical protein
MNYRKIQKELPINLYQCLIHSILHLVLTESLEKKL